MCGIGGIIDYNNSLRDKEGALDSMMLSMTHRGPDDHGFYFDKNAALGHRRLSIIGLSDGRQPIFNEDRSLCIVFNGEIYNYIDIKKTLVQKGHAFITHSDTEVILHAYEEYGVECLKHLRGMFAFGVWDIREEKLFLARDRLGIKPLYFINTHNFFSFSSEIKAFFVSGLHEPVADISALDSYLTLNYVLGPKTAFKGVNKLLPGQYMVYDRNKMRIENYWDFNTIKPIECAFDECAERLNELIKETVRVHMISEVPLGAFLSGGVDSSLTVAIMARFSEKPVKTFTVGYEGLPESSEFKYARIVADHFKTEHHEFMLNPAKFSEAVPKVLWHLDEPIAEYATIPLMLLSEMAKNHVTVMLSGEGADELFAGYPIYWYMTLIEKYRKIPNVIRSLLTDRMFKLLLGRKRQGKYIEWLTSDLEKRYLGNGSRLTDGIKRRLYSDDFWRSSTKSGVFETISSYYGSVHADEILPKMLYLDTKTWLPDDLLLKADKMTMAHSVELRVPFLDHEMVEFAASMPASAKLRGRETKALLKKSAIKFLPNRIVKRKKMGFPVPMKQWLQNDLSSTAKEVLLDPRSKQRGYFNTSYIERMLDSHNRSTDDLNVNIWSLYSLELWHRLFVDWDSDISYRRRILKDEGGRRTVSIQRQ